jgi:hypothetical protein
LITEISNAPQTFWHEFWGLAGIYPRKRNQLKLGYEFLHFCLVQYAETMKRIQSKQKWVLTRSTLSKTVFYRFHRSLIFILCFDLVFKILRLLVNEELILIKLK